MLIILAGAGLFGQGPAARAQAGAAPGVRFEFDRFVQRGADTRLVWHLIAPPGGEARLSLSGEFAEGIEFRALQPPPIRAELVEGKLSFVYAAAPGPVRGELLFRPTRSGLRRGEIRAGDASARFGQWVYP